MDSLCLSSRYHIDSDLTPDKYSPSCLHKSRTSRSGSSNGQFGMQLVTNEATHAEKLEPQ